MRPTHRQRLCQRLGFCGLVVAALPSWAAASQDSPPSRAAVAHVRPMGERAAYTLARGLEQSPTFRALVDRLERSDIVVYVAIAPQPSKAAPGGIQFLSASTVFRFLRVVLSPELTTSQMVALLGHELQHALEVAETREIRDRASLLQYYGRLGVDGRDHLSLDSQAARDTGERIKLELARTVPPVQRD